MHSRSNWRSILKVYLCFNGMDLVIPRDWTFLCHMFTPHDLYPVTPLSLSNPHNTDSTKIIGPGGKTIRQIIEDFELDAMDVEDDGRVMISSFNSTRAARYVATPLVSSGRPFVELPNLGLPPPAMVDAAHRRSFLLPLSLSSVSFLCCHDGARTRRPVLEKQTFTALKLRFQINDRGRDGYTDRSFVTPTLEGQCLYNALTLLQESLPVLTRTIYIPRFLILLFVLV